MYCIIKQKFFVCITDPQKHLANDVQHKGASNESYRAFFISVCFAAQSHHNRALPLKYHDGDSRRYRAHYDIIVIYIYRGLLLWYGSTLHDIEYSNAVTLTRTIYQTLNSQKTTRISMGVFCEYLDKIKVLKQLLVPHCYSVSLQRCISPVNMT